VCESPIEMPNSVKNGN